VAFADVVQIDTGKVAAKTWTEKFWVTPVGLSRECLVQDALKSCPASAPFACVRVGKRKYWAQAMSRAGRREGGPARALRTSASDAIADEMNDVEEVAQDLIYCSPGRHPGSPDKAIFFSLARYDRCEDCLALDAVKAVPRLPRL
jgi:hypothetical protein